MQPKNAILFFIILATVLSVEIIERGKKYSEDPRDQYKVYLSSNGDPISAWHDVPLYSDRTNQTYNMIVEIPRFTHAKFEISRDLKLNPIIQDKEDSKNRYLDNIFPWHGHVCNYGAFPQTWENPFQPDPLTGLNGDKDPLDVCEIGSSSIPTGSVVPVKVLGILGMQDRSETDWKVVVMNLEEARKRNIENVNDLNRMHPGLPDTIRNYFKIYKVPSGKPENVFAYDGVFKDVDFSIDVIRHTHEMWKEMINNCSISGENVGSFNTANTLQQTQCSITKETAMKEVETQAPHDPHPAGTPARIDVWSFVDSGAKDNKSILMMVTILMSTIFFNSQ